MKIIYVLVSSEKDYIAESALVSMYSLKKNNPEAEVILFTDVDTLNSLTGERGRLHEYVDEYITLAPPKDFNQAQKHKFLKTSVRQFVEGDYLYIDNDTVVCGDLDEIFRSKANIGAVLDTHVEKQKSLNKQIKLYLTTLKKPKIEKRLSYNYYNGGVIYSRDTGVAKEFYAKWHDFWMEAQKHGYNKDQPPLWHANIEMNNIILPINGVYNCQIRCRESIPYQANCKIIHYFCNSNFNQGFFMQDDRLLKYIREEGLDKRMRFLIDSARDNIEEKEILKGKELDIYRSPAVILARKISRDFPLVNGLIRALYRLLGYKI